MTVRAFRIAYSYIRFSSVEQRKGNSLARQLDAAKTLCEKNGWVLDESLSFHDFGRSGFTGDKQKELKRFLELVEKGVVKSGSVLIVERLDRLSRKEIDVALQLFLRIIQAGVDIATFDSEGQVIHTKKTIKDFGSLIVVLVQMATANEESEKKSKRALYNWKKKRENGGPITSRCPAWVRLENGKFILIPEKAKLVRQIFRWCIDGWGARRIEKHLNRKGIENIAYGNFS